MIINKTALFLIILKCQLPFHFLEANKQRIAQEKKYKHFFVAFIIKN